MNKLTKKQVADIKKVMSLFNEGKLTELDKIAQIQVILKIVDIVTPVLVIAENVTGKKLGKLMSAKVDANKANKAELATLSFNLAQFKKHALPFVTELNIKNKLNISLDECVNIRPSQFVSFLTESEKIRLEKNNNMFSFWLVESLISRYFVAQSKIK